MNFREVKGYHVSVAWFEKQCVGCAISHSYWWRTVQMLDEGKGYHVRPAADMLH
jgi:hypothetical protein